jgi:hypothetical protein
MADRDYQQELIDAAMPFWNAEADVTRRFFTGGPSRDQYVKYLSAAVYKELNPVIGYGPTQGYANGLHMEFQGLVDRFKQLDRGTARRKFLARLEMMTEEFEHYVVMAEVLEFVLGRPLTPEDAVQLPEDARLNEMRRVNMESGDDCLVAAMEMTEGGGSSTFREAAKLSGGEIEDRLAAAMKVIHRDEENHYLKAAAKAAEIIKSDDDFERMKRALLEVSIQRVRMRNEMFSEPMPETELAELISQNQG